MSREVAKAAIDFLIEKSVGRRNLEVDFFGGEPLMNFEVVKETVTYARSLEEKYNKRFRFTTTTNGVLLDDEKAAFLNREMHNVVLSLDGRREINDAMRPNAGGKGSYDAIVPRYQKFIAQRGTRITMSEALLPGRTWIFHRMCCTWRSWALTRYPWSRWSATRSSPSPLPRKMCPAYARSTTVWLWKCCGEKKREGNQFLPFYAGSGSGALRHQAAPGLRLRQRICGD